MDIKGMVINVLLPMLLSSGEEFVGEKLDDFQAKEPGWYATTVKVVHVVLKEQGAAIVADTANPYDDKVVAGLIETLETSATKHGVTLCA